MSTLKDPGLSLSLFLLAAARSVRPRADHSPLAYENTLCSITTALPTDLSRQKNENLSGLCSFGCVSPADIAKLFHKDSPDSRSNPARSERNTHTSTKPVVICITSRRRHRVCALHSYRFTDGKRQVGDAEPRTDACPLSSSPSHAALRPYLLYGPPPLERLRARQRDFLAPRQMALNTISNWGLLQTVQPTNQNIKQQADTLDKQRAVCFREVGSKETRKYVDAHL
jgi:hypothetical protein